LYFPKSKIIDTALQKGCLKPEDVAAIDEGHFALYASGEHQRVAKINPWVRKMLAIPIGENLEWLPDWAIKLACYIRIGEDFLPRTLIEQHIFWTLLRIKKWLVP
jgi:hypothetical protein